MGKRIIARARGKGGPRYRTTNYHFQPNMEFKNMEGKIIDIVNDPLRYTPLAKVEWSDNSRGWMPAAEGFRVGDSISQKLKPLSQIDVGSQIFAIEMRPDSGPMLCRASAGLLFSKDEKSCVITLPSRKKKSLNPSCRAIIGIPAGDGRTDKPWVKAGKKWHAKHARGKLYPIVSGNKMNAVDHPFGGKSGPGQSKSVSRDAPPGAKVGSIASRRTGKRK